MWEFPKTSDKAKMCCTRLMHRSVIDLVPGCGQTGLNGTLLWAVLVVNVVVVRICIAGVSGGSSGVISRRAQTGPLRTQTSPKRPPSQAVLSGGPILH